MAESKDVSTSSALLRVLTLDGGGAKGFYTLGVLKEIEAMVGCPLHQKFDLVFGTSTGAIIASLIALGHVHPAALPQVRAYRDVTEDRSGQVAGIEKSGARSLRQCNVQ